MAYIPEQLRVDTERENRRLGFLNQAMQSFADIQKSREEALAKEKAAKKQMAAEDMDFASKGVSPEMVAEYRKSGDASGIQRFFADAYSKDQDQKEAKKMADLKMAGVDFDYKKAQTKKLNSEAENPEPGFKEREIFKADLRAQNKQEAQPAQNEFAAAGYAKRARLSEEEFGKLPEGTGTDWKARVFNVLPNEVAPENLQKLNQAKRNFISAVLRKESGAAISDAEHANEDKKYFPQPGDTPDVVAQKARAREQAMLNLEAEGARALPRIQDATPRQQVNIVEKVKSYSPEQLAARKAELLQKMQASQGGQSIPGAP